MKWLDVAKHELGVSEVSGKVARPRIVEYFAAAGHGEVKDDETAWCSAFANFCMEHGGEHGTMSLAARSWLKWGNPCEPKPGAVGIWARRQSTWEGHVAFVESVQDGKVVCIGGNQAGGKTHAVTRRTFPISSALGFRWPKEIANSKIAKLAVAGTATSSASFIIDQAQQAKEVAVTIQPYVQWAGYAVAALSIICFGLVFYYRWQNIKERGQ